MKMNDEARPPLEEPLAEIERQLISAYVAGAGQNFHTLMMRDDEAAKKLLAETSLYASERLSEIEARSQYPRHLRAAE